MSRDASKSRIPTAIGLRKLRPTMTSRLIAGLSSSLSMQSSETGQINPDFRGRLYDDRVLFRRRDAIPRGSREGRRYGCVVYAALEHKSIPSLNSARSTWIDAALMSSTSCDSAA
jgi:hypothetical protein